MKNSINAFLVSLSLHMLIGFTIFMLIWNYLPELKSDKNQATTINEKTEVIGSNKEIRVSVNLKTINFVEKKKTPIKPKKNTKKQVIKLPKLNPSNAIKASYGDTFDTLTRREQQYIIDNWKDINELNELFSPKISKEDAKKIKEGDFETVVFYLNKDLSISDMYFEENNNSVLTESIGRSILESVKYYKPPRTKTLMKIKVNITKRGKK